MYLPGFLCLLLFSYLPIYGIILVFKQYNPVLGVLGSPWIGLQNFKDVVMTEGFLRMVRNTVVLGSFRLLFGFPASIIFALLLNELTAKIFKKTVQTISYLPYFISWVIISGIAYLFLNYDYGMINSFLKALNLEPVRWYADPDKWWFILTFTNIWKNLGWSTIIYLAALTNISPELYEATEMDGANRWQQTLHITLPGIMNVILICLILNVTTLVKDDFEQIYVMVGSNALLYEKTEVIGTWAYRVMQSGFRGYAQSTTANFMQSVISLILIVGTNFLVRRYDKSAALW